MNNEVYVECLCVPSRNEEACLEAMDRYGGDHWWEGGTDVRRRAYCQLKEPVLLGSLHRFIADLEALLERPVEVPELVSRGMYVEAYIAWSKYNTSMD